MTITEQVINAAKNGNLDELKILRAQHANLDYQDSDGWTALMTACATHHADCALYLISCGVNLELTAFDGWTALMIALDHNQEEIVKALLDAGAKTGRFNYFGMCELCITAQKPRLTNLLLRHGADPNQPHPILPLCKPLFLTLSHNKNVDPEFVKALVNFGAEVNAQTKEGQTPLMVSVANAEITKVLLECGADMSICDQDGETALDYAQKSEADPKALEVLKSAHNSCSTDQSRGMSIVAKRIGTRYDALLNYFKVTPLGSMPADMTVLSLLPPIDRCLIIERILKDGTGDRLTCIDKLSMAYLKAGWRDLADEFLRHCNSCEWLSEQYDYGFFQDKLNNIAVSNVSKRYADTLRKFPQYDTQSQFCKIVKELCERYNGKEILIGNETTQELDALHNERLEFIKKLGNDTGSKNVIPQVAESADCRGRNMFATETNCCFDVDDVNGLTIFCDRYGATLSIGGSQLLAWYKVDLKPGSIAKGDYVFNGYLYISCNDFAKLKPILVERGWSFHDTKSGPPFFAEGEVGTEPTESPSHPAKIEDNKASVDANEVNKERGVAQTSTSEEVLLDEDSLTPKPLGILVRAECTADSEQLHKRRGRLTNSRFFFALAVMLCVIAYGVYVLMVQRCKEIEKSKHPPQIVQGTTNHGVAATPDDGGKPLHKPDAGPHVIGTQKQCLGVQSAANKAKIAGAKKYAVIEWNAGVKEWERGNKCFSSQDFVGATNCFAEAKKRFDVAMQQCHNAIENLKTDAERRRLRVQDAANKAKSVGAKEHAIPEWNGAVGKWNSGDDKFKNGDYVGALELYHLSESLFVEAERISQSVV